MDKIAIEPCRQINAVVRPPGSKSITNRALICAAMAEGTSKLTGVLDSDDTRVMIGALQELGFDLTHDSAACTLTITGHGGRIPATEADLYIGNSGTTVRFLTAMLATGEGRYRLHGTPRMSERPIGDLVRSLQQLGASIECESPNGCPPVVIIANRLQGGTAQVAGNVSSQFLSGLLMAAPGAEGDVRIEVEGLLVSVPYVTMTQSVMRSFGAAMKSGPLLEWFTIPGGSSYRAIPYAIEPDASAASYFFAAAAVTGGQMMVGGLSRKSLQGDTRFCECLEIMGCEVRWGRDAITVIGRPLHGIEVDMNPISDTVQTLAVVALFADSPTRIMNVAHIRHKETDRISAVVTELRKFGATVEEFDDGMLIQPLPKEQWKPAEIDTYDDHRMAMSFAVAGLVRPGVVIRDPGCTAKTYPRFFEDFDAVCRGTMQ